MNFLYKKKFLKDLAILPENYRIKIEELVFKLIPSAQEIFSNYKVEQLTGYKEYFKIRLGSYRVGIKIDNGNFTFERVLHRKDIYNFFP